MAITALKSPVPKADIDRVAPYDWPVTSVQVLGRAPPVPKREFLEIVSARQSRREFTALTETELAEFLYLANRTCEMGRNNVGVQIEHRPAPSAGGLHAIQCLVHQSNLAVWSRYDSVRHAFELLSLDACSADELPCQARNFFSAAAEATVIWYVADMTRLGASYHHPESLAWRDAGALVSMHALVAEYLGYAYCPLGITGANEADGLSDKRELMGVGVALVGRRAA